MVKDYTKIAIAAVLAVFLVFILVQIVKFSGRMHDARAGYDAVQTDFDRTRSDRDRLQEEYSYYSNPANLSKELRSRFNYTLPGEKILILVPED
jgi:hypothetical protein